MFDYQRVIGSFSGENSIYFDGPCSMAMFNNQAGTIKKIKEDGDLVGGWPTPLKKIRVRQLGWWHSIPNCFWKHHPVISSRKTTKQWCNCCQHILHTSKMDEQSTLDHLLFQDVTHPLAASHLWEVSNPSKSPFFASNQLKSHCSWWNVPRKFPILTWITTQNGAQPCSTPSKSTYFSGLTPWNRLLLLVKFLYPLVINMAGWKIPELNGGV